MSFTIGLNHPSIAGHFPGNPVIPGVVLLDYILQELHQQLGTFTLKSIINVKFLAKVSPDVPVTITAERKAERISFFGMQQQKKIISGIILVSEQ